MNKLIKRLIESLFDDIDDIVDNDATQSVFTQNVIDDELNKLKINLGIKLNIHPVIQIQIKQKIYIKQENYIYHLLRNQFHIRDQIIMKLDVNLRVII